MGCDGGVTAGDEWRFAVGCADVDCLACGGVPYTASCVACDRVSAADERAVRACAFAVTSTAAAAACQTS